MKETEPHTLETMVDSYQLSGVILRLAEICEAKAQHIREAWQDADTANVWMRNARRLESFARKTSV